MSQSLTQVYLHIIFSTKHRKPQILPVYEEELFQYLSMQCDLQGCISLEVGGWIDHVHILCRMSKHITIPKLLEKVKGASSKWIKTRFDGVSDFYWQGGYGAFSVSPSSVDNLISYIRNQHNHHKTVTFEEEYLKILDQYKVDYDPKYLWD